MFSPTRIEVHHLGSIRHAVIEPDQVGITAFDGKTGSGKSTVLNAIAWACYGHIGGVDSFTEQSNLRSDFCPDHEPAGAVVEFDWRGSHIKAGRYLNRSRSGREAATAELWIDGQRQMPMSPDRLTEKIVEITGMSGRAFTSAFFIAQHQLENLAMGRPSDIKAIIEDQTGLGVLSKQIKAAADDAKRLSVAAEALPGTREEVEQARALLDQAQTAGIDTWERYTEATQAADEAHTTAKATRSTLEQLQLRERQAQRAALDHAAGAAQLDAAGNRVSELAAEVASFPTPNPAAASTDPAQIKVAVAATERAQAEHRHAVTHHTAVMERGRRIKNDLDAVDPTVEQRLRRLTDTIADMEGAVGALRHRHNQVSASLRIIDNSNADRHTCPTCHQSLADVAAVRRTLAAELRKIAEEGVSAKAELDRTRNELPAMEQQLAHRDRLAAEWESVTSAKRDADTALADTAARATETADRLRHFCDQPATTPVEEVLAAAAGLLDQLHSAHAAAEYEQRIRDHLTAARTTVRRIIDQRRHADEASQAALVDPDEMAAAAAADRKAQETFAAADQTRQETHVAATLAQGRAEEAERTHQRATQLLAAKNAARAEAETASDAHQVLVEQRRELLAEYTTVVSDAASEVMEQVGGGRHVGVQLGPDFIPRVVLPDGSTRPFRNCSGGEKMRAALCLCLGQAAQQAGSHQTGMLFADEIATGFDTDTTNAVMEALATLGRPIVLIGHNEQIRSIANRIYDFHHDGTATTVTTDEPVLAHAG